MCAARSDSNLSVPRGQVLPKNYLEGEHFMDVIGAGAPSQRAKLAGGGEV